MAEITLGDLLAWEPRLRLVAGVGDAAAPIVRRGGGQAVPAAVGERELTWAVAARASAPMLPTLRGGELVLLAHRVLVESGISLEPLLRELTAHDAAGVVVEAETVPARLVAAGAPLPVLTPALGRVTPDLEGDLNRLLTQRRGELYRAGTELGRLLAGLTTAGAELAQVLAATHDATGIPAVVVDRAGLPVAAAGGDPSGRPPSGEEAHAVRLAGGETLLLGPLPPDARALARLVGERVAVAAEAALALAAQARPRGPARAAALTALLTTDAGASVVERGARAAALGLATDATFRVALAAPAFGASEVRRVLSPLGHVHEASAVDGAHVAVLEGRTETAVAPPAPGGPKTPRPAARRAASDRGRTSRTTRWLALSAPVTGPVALPDAARQARYVAALLARGLIPGPVARFDAVADLGPFRLLYGYWGSEELAAFAGEALGELRSLDRRGTLRRTLLAFLDTGGSHVEAAARLGIHRNTLTYRLKQVAAVSGHDPADPSTRLVLHLALLAEALPPAPD